MILFRPSALYKRFITEVNNKKININDYIMFNEAIKHAQRLIRFVSRFLGILKNEILQASNELLD